MSNKAVKIENQESFTCERIEKAEEKLRKIMQENWEKEMTHTMFKCLAGEGSSDIKLVDLNEIRSFADIRINDVTSRIKALNKEKTRRLIEL